MIHKNPRPIFLGLKILAGQSSQSPSIEAVAEQFARPGAWSDGESAGGFSWCLAVSQRPQGNKG